MKAKYKMPKPLVHNELIHAFADGALIEELLFDGVWEENKYPDWKEDIKYRIDPRCNYALAKIAELGCDEAVELYLYWLDGGELELFDAYSTKNSWLQLYSPENDPFSEFMHELKVTEKPIRKKKRKIKQVLWVVTYEHSDIVKDSFFLDEGIEPDNLPYIYSCHKVPTCTRDD